jgi:hypothetical protein
LGTNCAKLASVCCERSEAHLLEVAAKFEADFGDNMRKTVEKETSGDVESVLTYALGNDADNRALRIHAACHGKFILFCYFKKIDF